MRLSTYDLLLYVLLFVFTISFPVDLVTSDLTYQLIIKIGLRALLLAYFIYLIWRNRVKIFGIANKKNILMCAPFLLICFSNIIASGIYGGFICNNNNYVILILEIILCLVSVINEEIIFRLFIQNALVNASSLKRIIISALIFALCHLLNVVNVRSVDALFTVFVQTIYTFGLGLLIAFLYEYGRSLTAAIVFHFIFNLFNTVIYQYLGGYTSDLCFYLTAIVIGVVVGVYAVLLYKLKLNKFTRYFRS